MSEKPDMSNPNEPYAFPALVRPGSESGMTLLDYFAGQALLGLLSHVAEQDPDATLASAASEDAAIAYAYAANPAGRPRHVTLSPRSSFSLAQTLGRLPVDLAYSLIAATSSAVTRMQKISRLALGNLGRPPGFLAGLRLAMGGV